MSQALSTAQNVWYSIRNRAPAAAAVALATGGSDVEILIYGDIGESWFEETTTAKQFVADLAEVQAQRITVRLNSYGGSVPDGVAIYNALRRHPAHIVTANDGVAMSIGGLIYLAGDEREAAPNSVLMAHGPWGTFQGDAHALRASADMLDKFAQAMATSYAQSTGRPMEEMLALLSDGQDHYYTAAEALDMGFATRITSQPANATALGSMAAQAAARYPRLQSFVRPAVAGSATKPQESPMPKTVEPQAFIVSPAVEPTAQTAQFAAPVAAGVPAATFVQPSPIAAVAPAQDPRAILAADGQRRESIRASFAKFAHHEGVQALCQQCEDDYGMTPEAASLKLLAHLGSGVTPVAGHVHVQTLHDETDKRRGAMASAIMARASVSDEKGRVRVDASNPYRGMRLLDMARASLVQAGIRVEGMEQRELVAAAFTQSTSDFPVLLENVMHRTLLGAYALQPDTWSTFCARGSVSDFRAHNRYRLGSFGNLDKLTELGEFRNKSIPDGEKNSISIGTKGNTINISRQTIINDDMGAFTGLASDLGRAAKRTVEVDVYAALLSNSGMGPLLADGKTLFHADHNNVSTGANSVAAWDAARVIMAKQTDISGNDYLSLTPATWLGPVGLEGAAKVVNASAYDPDTAGKLQRYNIAGGLVGQIVGSPRLSGTPWYFFAGLTEAPVMEVAFLDGNDLPYLELEQGFSVDGARWKVRLDFGVAGTDYRGAVRSTGA